MSKRCRISARDSAIVWKMRDAMRRGIFAPEYDGMMAVPLRMSVGRAIVCRPCATRARRKKTAIFA